MAKPNKQKKTLFIQRTVVTIFGMAAIGLIVFFLDKGQLASTQLPKSNLVVVAAGDIACNSSRSDQHCFQEETAQLVGHINPNLVLTLGDNQYEAGEAENFLQYFELSWGKFKEKIRPSVGNHEYLTSGASGYFAYFGLQAGDPQKGYYSFDLGNWHFIALNSNCAEVGGCELGSAQETWLRADLVSTSKGCILAYWHHPRFSSGQIGNNENARDFWQALYESRADLILVGHDHDYERFAPLDPNGNLDEGGGLTQFVVGTGGKSLNPIGERLAGSQVLTNGSFGVLEIKLSHSAYSWKFHAVGSSEGIDSGSRDCH